MNKNLNLSALLVLLSVVACKKDVNQITDEYSQTVSNARTTGSSTIYLKVTVDPLYDENGMPTAQIRSDNAGDYVHGASQVEAQILSSDGNFYMQTNNTFKSPTRTLKFPFNAARLEGKANYRLRTTCSEWLQNMDDGEEQVMRFRVWGNLQKGALDWNMIFDAAADTQTDYVKVKRWSRTVWTIEPANQSIAPANAKLTDASGAPIGSGYQQVPFKLTLTKK